MNPLQIAAANALLSGMEDLGQGAQVAGEQLEAA